MAISQRNAEIVIMSSVEATNILNENDMADDWAKFLENYFTSGVPDSKLLSKIGDVLEVDAVIQGEIVSVRQRDGSFGGSKGQTRVTVRYSMLGVKDGKLLWEATSDGIRGTATTVESAPPIIEAVNLAVDKIVGALPF